MFGSVFLSVFLAIGSILELEAAISDVFAAFGSWNLSLSIDFATFWWNLRHFGAESCRFQGICMFFDFEPFIVNGILQYFGAGTVHVTWGSCRAGFRLSLKGAVWL